MFGGWLPTNCNADSCHNQVHVVMTVDTADKMYFLFNLKRSYVYTM